MGLIQSSPTVLAARSVFVAVPKPIHADQLAGVVEPSNILIFLSGGAGNSDPEQSLGGSASNTTVTTGIDNLFDDVPGDFVSTGLTDYRCFYVFNDNLRFSLYSTAVWVDNVPGGSVAAIGFIFHDDIQVVNVTGNITGGTFTLSFKNNPLLIQWAGIGQTAVNIRNALAGFVVAQVSATQHGGTVGFEVAFQGADGNRYQPLLVLTDNSLSGVGPVTISVSKLVDGGPVNTVAPQTSDTITPPDGIVFVPTSFDQPAVLGTIGPQDGFPVWVQRTTPSNFLPKARDGFVLQLQGNPIRS